MMVWLHGQRASGGLLLFLVGAGAVEHAEVEEKRMGANGCSKMARDLK